MKDEGFPDEGQKQEVMHPPGSAAAFGKCSKNTESELSWRWFQKLEDSNGAEGLQS